MPNIFCLILRSWFVLCLLISLSSYSSAQSNSKRISPEPAPQTNKIYVQVKSTKLRATPKQWAPGVATLEYGTTLDSHGESAGWFMVNLSDGRSGFIHESAVTNKRIILKGSQQELSDLAVDETTVSLAGKGFGSNVEEAYKTKLSKTAKTKGKDINYYYELVDKILTDSQGVEDNLENFVREGMLNG